ncbi:site-specific DNA-methyltransferase [Polaribacter uvawellassae]|uniref:site-specific DNA-methyltransferase n=1 Tax=Polaribacter uvawellassae TaxID=3133495 RepID=UPI0032193B3D
MKGESLTPQQEKLNALKQILPEVFAEGKVDWEKLKATLGEDINFSNERYVLNWAGKSEAFKVLQTPTTKTLVPAKDESVNFNDTEHIFIEGENLEVLKVLQKSYFGKVKMIYIDPPYNTGNDSFIYPDKFSETKEDYEKRVGDKDEEGNKTSDSYKKNSKENGQYHSNWLNMMMPRLYLAKNLLKQDGVIFISIDDNEVHNLRLLMNEIFGEENFIAEFIWKSRLSEDNRNLTGASIDHEYILAYRKQSGVLTGVKKDLAKFSNPDNDPRGPWRSSDLTGLLTIDQRPNCHYDLTNPETGITYKCPPKGWRNEPKTMATKISEKRILWPSSSDGRPRNKLFVNEMDSLMKNISTLITKVSTNDGTKEVAKLIGTGFFTFPKPTKLIKLILNQVISKDDIVLDFFAGSGTTAHSVMELNKEDGGNRKCISVQLPELCDEKSEAYKAGYKTIADIAKERIRRAGKNIYDKSQSEIARLQAEIEVLDNEIQLENTLDKIKELQEKITSLQNQDLGFKVLKLSDSNFKQWQQITGKDKQALEEQMQLFIDPVAKNATIENMVYELLLKSGKGLNSTISHVSTSSTPEGFYAINETELILVLEKANQEIIDAVIASKPQKVIALDKLFKGNDQLKTNASLQMKDAGIEFKTI